MHKKFQRRPRAAWLPAIAVSTALGALMPAESRAQSVAPGAAQEAERRRFDIPPQALPDALPMFSRQAGIQISAHGDVVRGGRTQGVVGTMTVEAALRQLLAGTELTFRLDAGGALITAASRSNAPAGAGDSAATLLEPLVVVGTAPEDHAGAADRASSIRITSADLDRRNPSTIRGVFAGEASVSVGGGQPVSQKVYVQGIEETNLAVSIDGARQNNKIFHHSGTNLLDPSLLKRVRVDPGVAPADAGPGALGGAIVYETVDVADVLAPGRSLGGFVFGSFDSNGGTFSKGGSVYGRSGGFEALGYVKFADGDNYKDGDGHAVRGSGADVQSFLGKTGYESLSGHRIELSGEQVHDQAQRRFRANVGRLTNRNEPDRLYDMKRHNYTVNYSMPKADGLWDPKIVLGYGKTKLGIPEPYGSVGETSTFNGKFENNFNLNHANTVTVGIDFYDDEARYSDPTTDIKEAATNVGLYAQARLTPVEALRLSFGLRGDRHRFEGVNGAKIDNTGLSGNASLAYDVTQAITLKAGYSNVFGGIALAENFILNENWSYARGIEPVRAENATLGIEARHRHFTFGAGVFRNNFDNARNESFGGGPHLTSDFKTKGYNLSAGYDWGAGFARVTYTDTDFKIDGKAGDSDLGQYLGTPIGRIVALEAAHRIEPIGLTLGGSVSAALKNKDTVGQGLLPLDSYQVVNLFAEYRPAMAEYLTLRVEANNLFDALYADRATYGQEFSNVIPVYEPGRSILLKAKATF